MNKQHYTIDASGKILGRLASEIAVLLIGKNKPNFLPYKDGEDLITVINTEGIRVSGKKEEQKKYFRFSGYPGGLKETSYKKLFAQNPMEVLRRAVLGMLPKNKLRSRRIKRLKLYKSQITAD